MKLTLKKNDAGREARFNVLKLKVIEHLEKLEREEEQALKKSLDAIFITKGRGLPVGTIRTWKGKKFIKLASGKWRPKYDAHTRGAKIAVSHIKKKIMACKDEYEMMHVIMEHRDRFSDKQGNPLPFVQELYDLTQEKADNITSSVQKKASTKEGQEDNNNTGEDKEYKEYEGKGKEAVDFILNNGAGSVVGAFNADHMKKDSPVKSINIDYETIASIVKMLGNNRIGQAILNIIKFANFIVDEDKGEAIATADEGTLTLKKDEKRGGWRIDNFEKSKQNKETNTKDNKEIDKPAKESTAEDTAQNKGLDKIRKQYNNSKQVAGDEDEIYVGDEAIKGTWKLVEASAPSASHDENTFHKTEGFPQTETGSTVNDRDYEHDTNAQRQVISIAGKYDGRALSFDSPVVVTKDGVVVSGNNRTMSSKLASKNGTDKAYIEALTKRAKKYGFSAKDVTGFEHPRVVFEVTNTPKTYSTKEFAKYNESQTKAMSPIESAVKVSKIIKLDTISEVANVMSDFETMGEFYADKKAVIKCFDALQKAGVINEFNRVQYEMDGTSTGAGKEFLETVLIGSVVNETNIRGLNREGCKNIRRKLVRAIVPLVNNKSLDGYSIIDELNEAINISMEVKLSSSIDTIDDYAKQGNMFGKPPSDVAIAFAKRLDGTEKAFASFMQDMNVSLNTGASGQVDIFIGSVESKQDVLSRLLNLKKALTRLVQRIKNRTI